MFLFNKSFGGQAVVIKSHRIENVVALHPFEAGNDVSMGVGEDMADVKTSRDGGGWRVDGERRFFTRSVEGVCFLIFPQLLCCAFCGLMIVRFIHRLVPTVSGSQVIIRPRSIADIATRSDRVILSSGRD